MDYLKENADWIEPIVYTSGLYPYTDHLVKFLDPKREVFKNFLYQNACYMFEIPEEDVLHLIKDISRFQNRDIRRSILLDPKPTNYMMTPENIIPVHPYTAENPEDGFKDEYLLSIMQELDELKDLEDVRPTL